MRFGDDVHGFAFAKFIFILAISLSSKDSSRYHESINLRRFESLVLFYWVSPSLLCTLIADTSVLVP
jgi:hypothetical protein